MQVVEPKPYDEKERWQEVPETFKLICVKCESPAKVAVWSHGIGAVDFICPGCGIEDELYEPTGD